MTWWTAVPALTPLVAHDTLRTNATHFLDGVGSNNMELGGCTSAEVFPYPTHAGAGLAMPYTSAVSLPSEGVFFGLYRANSQLVVFYETLSGDYALGSEPNGKLSSTNNGVSGELVTLGFGALRFVALVKGASTSQAYIDGAFVGVSIANAALPISIAGMGYGTSGNAYNFDSSDRFVASGIFSGTPTLAELQALEAAVRAELAAPPANTNILSVTSLAVSAGSQAVGAPTPRVVDVGQVRVRLSAGFAGLGSIEGVVTVNTVPAAKQVRLFDKATGALVAATQSASNGVYAFTGIDAAREYFVVSHDNARQYNAVVSDMITP